MSKIALILNNNRVNGYQEVLNDNIDYEGILIETDLDLDILDIINDYKFENGKLVELTEEEKEENKIDICPTKTVEQRLEEAEQKLAESEEEKKLLKAQVEANASSYEFLESCVMEMAGKVYA